MGSEMCIRDRYISHFDDCCFFRPFFVRLFNYSSSFGPKSSNLFSFFLNSSLSSLIASVKRMHQLLHHLRTPVSQSCVNSRAQEMLKMRLLVQLRNRLQNLDQRQTIALRKATGVLPALFYVIHCTVKHQVCNNTIS